MKRTLDVKSIIQKAPTVYEEASIKLGTWNRNIPEHRIIIRNICKIIFLKTQKGRGGVGNVGYSFNFSR